MITSTNAVAVFLAGIELMFIRMKGPTAYNPNHPILHLAGGSTKEAVKVKQLHVSGVQSGTKSKTATSRKKC